MLVSRFISSTVEAIDHKSRVVTLRRPQGDTVTFTASPEARNLDQVSVGDIVTAEYYGAIISDSQNLAVAESAAFMAASVYLTVSHAGRTMAWTLPRRQERLFLHRLMA